MCVCAAEEMYFPSWKVRLRPRLHNVAVVGIPRDTTLLILNQLKCLLFTNWMKQSCALASEIEKHHTEYLLPQIFLSERRQDEEVDEMARETPLEEDPVSFILATKLFYDNV